MKKILKAAAVLALAAVIAVPVFAEHFDGEPNWQTTFTENGVLTNNFIKTDAIRQLQPGDDLTLTITTIHNYAEESDWFISNEVTKTLEEGAAASGGAYEYTLTFKGPGGEKTLYDSKTVGGVNSSEGLKDATNAMEDYIFLDTMKKGQTGTVTLNITLDGETEMNNYQRTLGDLKINFAVEVEEPQKEIKIVKTGDETNNFPFFIAIIVCGVVILVIAIILLKKRRENAR
ncbi:MAG: LPXTG cell wall anchor domain-containing protein [Eubacterium sp.]|nr:LPXTG cell wall anchor domain-containing protein [Eubacterium sp.]